MTLPGAPGGARVWRHQVGDPGAPLIVLVHGSMDRSAGLLRLSRRLDRWARVARYDRRGYGHSAALPGAPTMEAHTADLLDVIDERPALVVGHSFGGNVALAAAARRPDLIRGVAVYETPLTWEPWYPPDSQVLGVEGAEGTADPGDVAERFLRAVLGDAPWERLPALVRANRRAEGATLVAELADLRARPPWLPEQITVPVVAGCGARGLQRHQRATRHLASSLPLAHLVVLEGLRHDAPHTAPEVIAPALVEELARRVGDPWAAALSARAPSR